jgi:hypothetical protein
LRWLREPTIEQKVNNRALPAELAAAAPGLSRGLAGILRALAALIARAFLRDPRHVGLILPLHGYITRTLRRFDRLLARLAAGEQRTRPPGPASAASAAPRTSCMLPRRRGWLVATLRHEAAGYASQLDHLLSEPAHARLIAATPQAARLLRPLCHLLGIAPDCLRPTSPAPGFPGEGRGPSRSDGKGEGGAAPPRHHPEQDSRPRSIERTRPLR